MKKFDDLRQSIQEANDFHQSDYQKTLTDHGWKKKNWAQLIYIHPELSGKVTLHNGKSDDVNPSSRTTRMFARHSQDDSVGKSSASNHFDSAADLSKHLDNLQHGPIHEAAFNDSLILIIKDGKIIGVEVFDKRIKGTIVSGVLRPAKKYLDFIKRENKADKIVVMAWSKTNYQKYKVGKPYKQVIIGSESEI